MAQIMGILLQPLVIQLLDHLTPRQVDASQLVTVMLNDGPHLAHWDALPLNTRPHGQFEVVRPPCSIGGYLGNAFLVTDNVPDTTTLASMYPESVWAAPATDADVPLADAEPPASLWTQRITSWFELVEQSLLVTFADNGWQSVVKEAQFSTHLARLNHMRQECAVLDSDYGSLGLMDELSRGLLAGK